MNRNLQIRRAGANILSKQSQTLDKWRPSSLDVGVRGPTPFRCETFITQGLELFNPSDCASGIACATSHGIRLLEMARIDGEGSQRAGSGNNDCRLNHSVHFVISRNATAICRLPAGTGMIHCQALAAAAAKIAHTTVQLCLTSCQVLVVVCVYMLRYTVEHHVFLHESCVKYGCARKCRRKFSRKFPSITVRSTTCTCELK
jgi:hypothetical protein